MARGLRSTLLVLVAAALAAGPAAAARDDDRIINGSPATQGEYPAQGFLAIDTDGDPSTVESFCGGTLIGNTWFLTAAHCAHDGVAPFAPSQLRVLLGHVDFQEASDIYAVSSIDVHPDYADFEHLNDVAMLRLNRPAPYPYARPIRLDEAALWAPGTMARIVGWGDTDPGPGQTISTTLLEANVPIRPDSVCSDDMTSYGLAFDPNTMVCAGDGNADTCQGDSGGPLMVRPASQWVIVGVTSWGNGCNDPAFPGIYARLGAPGLNQWVMDRFPRASFTSSPAHTNQPTTFTSTSFYPPTGGSFTQFNWELDGDFRYDATGASVTHTYLAHGSRVVHLEAVSPSGDRAVTSAFIDINASPAPVAGRYTVREGRSVVLNGFGVDADGGPMTYAWDVDRNGSFEASAQRVTFSALRVDGPASRSPMLRVCDTEGACMTEAATVRVVNVRPVVRAGRDRRVRRARRLRFRVTARDVAADRLRYRWTCGNRARGSGRTVTCRYRRAGRYVIRITVTDGDGGVGRDSVRVRVRR
jgi:secreted trypsin-like serine protease